MELNRDLEILRTNIIRWYSFKENSNILVAGSETKELCDFLNENHSVKSLDADVNYISNTKFDYIIVKDNISYLENYKENLAEDGVILLLLNNRWGVEFLAGGDGFETLYGNKNHLLDKMDIEKYLNDKGFKNYRFFYPLPNYEFANTIFSDEYLPEATDSKLANNNIYLNDNYLVFNEIELLKSFTKNGEFTKFTNSYLIEINPKSMEKAIFFGNSRKEEYKLITKILEGQVEKVPYSEKAVGHIEQIKENIEDLKKHGFDLLDTVENGKVISKYVTLPNMYEATVNKIKNGELEKALEIIEKIYNDIKEKFASDKVDTLNQEYFEGLDTSKLFIVKKAYIDLVFENMFFDNQGMYVYDQEWVIDNCPLEFILFRLINNMYLMNSEISEIIPRDEMLKKFGLLYCFDEFLKAESIFQNKVINQDMIAIYNRANELSISKEEIMKAKENANMIELYKAENIKKEKYILELQSEIIELKKQIENK